MNTNEIVIVELAGTPRERGRIYGETAKALIAEVVVRWKDDLGNFKPCNFSKYDNSEAYLEAFLSQTNYLKGIEKWAPELLEEVKGIAEGSGQAFETILGLQLIDEEWLFGLSCQLGKPTNKCTAFGVPRQNQRSGFAGQNMDVPSWVEGLQVLLRIMPTEKSSEALIFSVAGVIGLNGMNSSGLGITCNTLAQLTSSIDGLPVSFIVRSILRCQTLDHAEQFLRSIKHASGQNYILSSRNEMRCFECSAHKVVRYIPEHNQGRVFHTNHPLVNDDISELSVAKNHNRNSNARLNSISTRLGEIKQVTTLEAIKTALSAHDNLAHPVSRQITPDNIGNSIGYTAGASIYEFSEKSRLHLSAGPPCQTDFKVFEFRSISDQ